MDQHQLNSVLQKASNEQRDQLNLEEIKALLSTSGTSITDFDATPYPVLVHLKNSREFGMIISAGKGGEQAELYASSCRKGQAYVSAATQLTSAEAFFELFKETLAYKEAPSFNDQLLIQFFGSLIAIANQFSPTNPDAEFVIENLELNPVYFSENAVSITAGSCIFGSPKPIPAARPIQKIGHMLHPESIGIIGVSATKMNFGRIILKNVLDSGYSADKMYIVRPGEEEIDGVRCIDSLKSLDHKLDLFIVAVGAEAVFDMVDDIIATDAAQSVMLIPGGLGETTASREKAATMAQKMNEAHRHGDGGPIFLGGNCLGIVSHPGTYDSWFIPKFKLPKPQKKAVRNSVMLSQSGAFMITRISQNPWFDPNYMVALGNQNDLTHSDMVNYFADNPEVDLIGVYIEGFKELDGLAFAEAVRRAILNDKQVVVYKAGQSEPGQNAALGHTASIAGDYEICETVLRQSGAIVAKTMGDFNDLFYIADTMHHKTIKGNRLGAISGAGFETVGMADSIHSETFSLEMGTLEPHTYDRLSEILKAKRLDALMEIRNPFDINPGADDEAHVQCTQAFADDPNIDAVVVGLDPASPMMRTLAECPRPGFDIHSEESITQQLPKLVDELDIPIIGIVDGGSLYDPMIEMLKDKGVCTFRSCDQGVKALVQYIEARLNANSIKSRYKN